MFMKMRSIAHQKLLLIKGKLKRKVFFISHVDIIIKCRHIFCNRIDYGKIS